MATNQGTRTRADPARHLRWLPRDASPAPRPDRCRRALRRRGRAGLLHRRRSRAAPRARGARRRPRAPARRRVDPRRPQGRAVPPGPRRDRCTSISSASTSTWRSTRPVSVELIGADDAPGVVDGGVLDQVTRELNVEALPNDIPETIEFDVSKMEINDTLHAVVARRAQRRHAARRPRGDDVSRPSRRRASTSRPRTPTRHRDRRPASSARARRDEDEGAADAEESGRRGRLRRRVAAVVQWLGGVGARRLAGRRARQPGRPLRRHAPQRRLPRRRAPSARALGPAEGRRRSSAACSRRAVRASAARASRCCCPQTYMNEAGRLRRPRARRAEGAARARARAPRRDRPAVRRHPHARRRRPGRPQRPEVAAAAASARPASRRVRIGVGRPDSTDPDIVAGYVLGRCAEPKAEVQDLVDRARDAAEALVLGDPV